MTEKVTIKMSVATNKVGSDCEDEFEIDKAQWDGWSLAEKSEFLEETYAEHRQNYVEGWVHAYDKDGNCLSTNI